MAAGSQSTQASINQALTANAVLLRDVCQSIAFLNEQINGGGAGTAYLESLGFSAGDAADALTKLGYLNTVSGVYKGTATQASTFSFENATAPLWAT